MKKQIIILTLLALSSFLVNAALADTHIPQKNEPNNHRGNTSDVSQTNPTDVKPYKLNVCIVTGNDLGSMGDPRTIVYQGQEIKFCCKPCEAKFRKNPEKYLTKMAAEEAKLEKK